MTVGLEAYLNSLRAKGYTEGTIAWQRCYLERFQTYLNAKEWTDVTIDDIHSYLALQRKRKLRNATLKANLTAIKGLFSYLFRKGMISSDPAISIEPPKSESRLPDIPSEEEMLKILAVPDLRTPVGIRDRAILELLYSSGIRRKELINLNLTDVDLENGCLMINQGKNHKDRVVPVGETACKFIEAYLRLVRWWFIRNPSENALFIDSQNGTRLAPVTINYIVGKAIKKSGVKKRSGPHIFRHAMATHLLQNQADIRHIQMMLGHASVACTEIYTRLMVDDLKEVHRRAHPHGRRAADSDS